MSISNLFFENNYKLYCEELDTDKVTIDGISFEGGELVKKASGDVLTANKIAVCKGGSEISDSVADVNVDGSINIPENQSYNINSQPVLYQNIGDSKYMSEVDECKANDKVQTNKITSIGTNDDIFIDGNGTGAVRFSTIQNNGALFGGKSGAFNWTIKCIYDGIENNASCFIAGHSTILGDTLQASIGSNNQIATDWTPLYINPINAANAYVVFGNISNADALAKSSKIVSVGDITTTTNLKAENNVISGNDVLADGVVKVGVNGTDGHRVGNAATGDYLHSFAQSTGQIAHTYQNEYPFSLYDPTTNINGLSTITNIGSKLWRNSTKYREYSGDANLYIYADADNSANVNFSIYNEDTTTVILNVQLGLTPGINKLDVQFPSGNLPTSQTAMSLRFIKNSGASTSIIIRDAFLTIGGDA